MSARHARSPRRFWPMAGRRLTRANIQGPWRPTAAIDCAGVFAVTWHTSRGDWWAPLHDFDPRTQLELIESCVDLDRDRVFDGAWPFGRGR